MQLVEGPFRHFAAAWRFQPLGERACKVEFSMEFEFAEPRAARRCCSPLFERIADSMVDAFTRRADEIHGAEVEVVHARPGGAEDRGDPACADGATACAMRVAASGLERSPAVGIFGKRAAMDTRLADGDRVGDLPAAGDRIRRRPRGAGRKRGVWR